MKPHSIRRCINNQRGDVYLYTVFVVMAFMMLMSVMIQWVGIGANMTAVRNAVKEELAAVSIRIESDTYQALREGNLDAYNRKLTSSTVYQNELRDLVIEKINDNINLNNKNFTVQGISLTFHKTADHIEYILTFDIRCRATFLGSQVTIANDDITLSGRHLLKPI